jgi:hypothetical protein
VPLVAAPHSKTLTPRQRAACGMVLYLRDYALLQLKQPLMEKEGFVKNGCPTSISGVTWGMAKTDPWDHDFLLRCAPGALAIGSPGPDGKAGTDDDLWSDRPMVDHDCAAACARAKSCKSSKAICDCKLSNDAVFYADTCALADSCEAFTSCLESAIDGRNGMASCQDFGRLAAKAANKPQAAKALSDECERDVLRYTELPCVAASKTAPELTRCFLTVNRFQVEQILSR